MGLLKQPHPRILPVICNRGWRLVNLGMCVYFDVRWGRWHPTISQRIERARGTLVLATSLLYILVFKPEGHILHVFYFLGIFHYLPLYCKSFVVSNVHFLKISESF